MNSETVSLSSDSEYDVRMDISNLSISETTSNESRYSPVGSLVPTDKTKANAEQPNPKKALETTSNIKNENFNQTKDFYTNQAAMQDVHMSSLSDKEDNSAINPTGNNSYSDPQEVYPDDNDPHLSNTQPTRASGQQSGPSLFGRLVQLFSYIPQIIPFYGGRTTNMSVTNNQSVTTRVIENSTKQLPDAKRLNVNPKPDEMQEFAWSPKQQHTPYDLLEKGVYGGRMTAQMLKAIGLVTTDAIEKLHKEVDTCPADNTELPDPQGLKVSLKTHQRQALAWLAWREQQLPPGGILADDMGLGKTLTIIAHILRQNVTTENLEEEEWLSRHRQFEKLDQAVKKSRATLIIVPASIIHQWAKEIERRVKHGYLKFIIYHGPGREKNIHKLIDNDIVLTTYAIIGKEMGIKREKNDGSPTADKEAISEEPATDPIAPTEIPTLLKIVWERIVLDEAHNIKNHKTVTAKSVCLLMSISRWAITGTPIQNNLMDLYSLLRFLRFSPFDEFNVWKRYIGYKQGDTTRLKIIVKALLLRRTKHQINLEGKAIVALPSRTNNTIMVDLNTEERTVYDKLFLKTQSTVRAYLAYHKNKELQKAEKRISAAGASRPHSKCNGDSCVPSTTSDFSDGPRQTQSGQAMHCQILVLLLRLQQCCSHLSLLKSRMEPKALEAHGIYLCEQLRDMNIEEITGDASSDSARRVIALFDISALSSKLKRLLEKIKSIHSRGRQKSIIVSQWTGMLKIVAHNLEKTGIDYVIIQGNIPLSVRMDIVDEFNTNTSGPQVMLLSLKAGGVGLNLIGGNHLFLMDNHWNPALDEQACDRIYRMGQMKDVFIYKFLCKNTIEERIVALQEKKNFISKICSVRCWKEQPEPHFV